ncbi:MAG: HAMP domain-containing protein [Acidobacteria bacterium]|nr:MAG: HAMP domain-containing protein [Acidobacteriota bacterium]REK11803.1 MAG: HAMP domain-containing protein [Acidobacteriota bacterium]
MAASDRRRMGLGARLLLVMVTLVLVSAGSAIVITWWLGRGISERAIESALRQSQSVQSRFVQDRFEQLELIARVFGSDPALVSFLQESLDRGSVVSILDLLAEYQADLGFDFAMVLDFDGVLVTRTDDRNAAGDDFSQLPLVEVAFAEGRASGFWQEDGALYTAVAVPITQQFDLIGTLITGYRIDEQLVREIGGLSTAEIAFLSTEGGGLSVVASTLPERAAVDLLQRIRQMGGVMEIASRGEEVELELDEETWLTLVAPLRDAFGDPIGATVSLASVRRESAAFSRLLGLLLLIGGLSIAAAMALSILLGRRLLRPVRGLVNATEKARAGNYDPSSLPPPGTDEVGRLSSAFAGLLTELREKRDMEAFVGNLTRSLPDPGAPAPARIEPSYEDAMVLGIDLRRYAHQRNLQEADLAQARMTQDLRRIRTVVGTLDGELNVGAGQRLYVAFRGEAAAQRALSAAQELRNVLGRAESAFEDPEPPAIAVTCGMLLRAAADAGNPEPLLVGLPILQLDGLLREAAEGDLVLSRIAKDRLAEEGGMPQDLQEQRGLLSTQALYLVPRTARVETLEIGSESVSRPLRPTGGARTAYARLEPGSVLGDRYEIESVLGAGGMGVVYRARDRELGDLVALKTLKGDFMPGAAELETLKNELRLARKITHPNVVRTYDLGEVDGLWFISMEYVRGLTLRYLIDQPGRIPYLAAVRLMRQVVSGLGAAHGEGVLHLDIKPENIVIEGNGNAKLMDFGISQSLRSRAADRKGKVVGTPHYLAPEQIDGKEPDERADIYACGVVMYQIFTERLPFSGESVVEILRKQASEAIEPPREHWPQIPAPLDQLIMRCLERQPEGRFQSAEALLQALSSRDIAA